MSAVLTDVGALRTGLLTVPYLDKLQHANADDLAFYPLTTLAEALAAGHVVACEDNGEPAGYLWYGALSGGRDVTIFQACVDYDSRRRYLGFRMVAELTAIAKASGCTGIRLKCASSADSNRLLARGRVPLHPRHGGRDQARPRSQLVSGRHPSGPVHVPGYRAERPPHRPHRIQPAQAASRKDAEPVQPDALLMTPDRCPCWRPWDHSDPTCPVVREQARTAAIAERLLASVDEADEPVEEAS